MSEINTKQRSPQCILVVMDAYLPGRLSGGPVTSVANMIQALHGEYEFLVVTRNADLNGEVYPNVALGTPVPVGGATVIYLADRDFTARRILSLAASWQAHTLYLNSFFSPTTIRVLLHLQLRGPAPRPQVVLAPRGEFSSGALSLKGAKKRAYLQLFRLLGLRRLITTFQASSPLEERDVYRVLGPERVQVAADMPDRTPPVVPQEPPLRRRLVFIARIAPMKNLHYALSLLKTMPEAADLDLYGPLEDESYWQACQRVMATLPSHIRVTYRGLLAHEEVSAAFAQYTAFLFPTQGENYGHVVLESLSAGCPVILSDRTPWQDLQSHGVGWVCDLAHPEQFQQAVQQVLNENQEQARERRARCVAYARRVANDPHVREANRRLFSQDGPISTPE